MKELNLHSGPKGEVTIGYRNWRGVYRIRKIIPLYLQFCSNEYHPKPQWLLMAEDVEEENIVKSFAMSGINMWFDSEDFEKQVHMSTISRLSSSCAYQYAEFNIGPGMMRKQAPVISDLGRSFQPDEASAGDD